MRQTLLSAVIAFGLGVAAPGAQAAVITGTFEVAMSGFGLLTTPDPLVIRFSISFDDAADIAETTSGISLLASDFVPASPLAFAYFRDFDVLSIGGSNLGIFGYETPDPLGPPSPIGNDVNLSIRNPGTSPTYATGFVYFGATDVLDVPGARTTVTFTPASVPVPEPASLALLGAGLLGLSASRRTIASRAA